VDRIVTSATPSQGVAAATLFDTDWALSSRVRRRGRRAPGTLLHSANALPIHFEYFCEDACTKSTAARAYLHRHVGDITLSWHPAPIRWTRYKTLRYDNLTAAPGQRERDTKNDYEPATPGWKTTWHAPPPLVDHHPEIIAQVLGLLVSFAIPAKYTSLRGTRGRQQIQGVALLLLPTLQRMSHGTADFEHRTPEADD